VADLLAPAPSPTAAAAARAEQLLSRHGVLGRDAVLAEGLPGGFAGLYPVLTALEEAGRARRGYFVEGLGGAQFALPGVLDRLRAGEPSGAVTLAAADPANPYGAGLPWPESRFGQPSRSAGAYVVLLDGRLAAFVERGGRRLLTFAESPEDLEAAAGALAGLARRLRRLSPATVNGGTIEGSALGRALAGAGFVPSYRGMILRRP
jgi:ATP-dependent Lhr-like helicase